ncbi:MAG: hypothetical protein ACI8V2_005358 [Candidatus Latescibacterota bacterium]|jgi:hypothetical protein
MSVWNTKTIVDSLRVVKQTKQMSLFVIVDEWLTEQGQ